jgi:MinD-like ATPase involved in chromosome partitioning or flagellar assembly
MSSLPLSRESIPNEESTMITSLDDLKRARSAREGTLGKARAPSPPTLKNQGGDEAPPKPSIILSDPEQTDPPLNDHATEQHEVFSKDDYQYIDPLEKEPHSPDDHVVANETVTPPLDDPSLTTHPMRTDEAVKPFTTWSQHETQDDMVPPPLAESSPTSNQADTHTPFSADAHKFDTSDPILIAFFNPRGAVGSTSSTINVGGELLRYHKRVALVDMDLQMSALPSCLDVKLERTLAELVVEASNIQEGPITSALDYHESGLAILAQEGRINEIGQITPHRLPRFYEALSSNHDVIIADGLRNFSDHAVSVMDLAHKLVIMVTQDIPAVRSAYKALSIFERLGYDRDKVCVVLNRFSKKAEVPVELIEDTLDREIFHTLSNDFRFISKVISEGRLAREVNPKHTLVGEYESFALKLISRPDLLPQSRGLFGRLFSRRKR